MTEKAREIMRIDEYENYDAYVKMGEVTCAHEALEKSLPPSQKGGAHNLVCTCPKCSIHC